MEIQGTVSAIVFANEETGYRVLRLDNNLVAVGVVPMVSVGAEYKFVGEFVNNAKHGKQFAFTEIVLVSGGVLPLAETVLEQASVGRYWQALHGARPLSSAEGKRQFVVEGNERPVQLVPSTA